ncbi:MAG: UvrD-helicase domain-containing protein [Dehalococcoidia bacterium]|nr:UvrD-helicase domain-containing protein [Dehalococcoidia bacterium]
MDILAGLNPAQRDAVQHIEGPLLIIAGPGSGKTRVIVHRIAYLVKVCGVTPYRILAVTFTNKAAKEMRDRLLAILGPAGVEDLTLGTFHAICARILRREGKHIGLDPAFSIYDGEDQLSVLKRALDEAGVDSKRHPPRAILSAISAAKSQLIDVEEFGKRKGSYYDEIVLRVYQAYEALLAQQKALDFDDLLVRTVRLFQQKQDVLARYQSRYTHVLIDEFQDTNIVQYSLARLMAGKWRNICVVGDPDQSIYSWRQADIRNILNFEKDYPEAKVVYLEQNYRSTGTILKAADQVIAANKQRKAKNLWTENPPGARVALVEAYNEQEEAQFVVGEVERQVKAGRHKAGDFAVMYRVNAQSRAVEEAFLRHGLPYRLVGATKFYQRREVKDALAYLRLIHNPWDDVSLARVVNVPNRGIGEKTLDDLSRWAKGQGLPLYAAMQAVAASRNAETPVEHPFHPRTTVAITNFVELMDGLVAGGKEQDVVQLLDEVARATGYRKHLLEEDDGEERWENVRELRTVASEYQHLGPERGLADFLEGVALVSDTDNMDEKRDAVTLITLHQAKGLEFPVVFIVGTEEGLLPHSRSLEDPSEMEEERRLFYVGMTRAKEQLFLVRAYRRAFMGAVGESGPSRFLRDIPRELVTTREGVARSLLPESGWRTVAAPQKPATSSAPAETAGAAAPAATYRAGDHVRHATFGEGVVVSCSALRSGDHEVTVVFKTAGLKKLLLSYAPLERVEG